MNAIIFYETNQMSDGMAFVVNADSIEYAISELSEKLKSEKVVNLLRTKFTEDWNNTFIQLSDIDYIGGRLRYTFENVTNSEDYVIHFEATLIKMA